MSFIWISVSFFLCISIIVVSFINIVHNAASLTSLNIECILFLIYEGIVKGLKELNITHGEFIPFFIARLNRFFVPPNRLRGS
jgi:hypothetical protein